jgi:hypothetical protein
VVADEAYFCVTCKGNLGDRLEFRGKRAGVGASYSGFPAALDEDGRSVRSRDYARIHVETPRYTERMEAHEQTG